MTGRANATEAAFWADDGDDVALQNFYTLVNTVDDGIYQLDTAGRFVAVNDAIPEMIGYTRDELLGEHVSVVLEDEDIDRITREISTCLETDGRIDETFELTARTADGEGISCELRLSLLVDGGTFRGSTGIVREISDRKRGGPTRRERAQRKHQRERENDLIDRILETSPVGIQVLDADGEVTRMNGRFRDILDISADEAETYDPSNRPVYDETGVPISTDDHPFARTLESGEPVYDEVLQVELPDGSRRWVSVNAAPLFDETGELDRVVTAGEDVTDLKERERELEAELDEIFGRVSDAFYALDDEWRYTHVNEHAADFMGRSREELLGANAWDVFPEAVDSTLYDNYHEAMATQEPVSFERYSEPFGIWAEVTAYPSETGLSVYFRDITDRKERERELAESERRYRTLAEYFPNGLVTLFDHDLEYTLAAGQGFDRIPVEPEDLEGRQFHDVWPDETAGALEPAFQAALEGEERSVELEYADREWVLHAVPITDERGDVFAGMTMAQDITEQKERERYLEDANAQLEAATEAGAVGTWEWHVPEDEMVTGATFARTFGVDPDAAREGVSSERFLASVHEDDRPRVEEKMATALETCGEYEAEYRVWNAADDCRWVVSRGRVECDAEGNPVTFPGAVTDITERKRAELELRRSEAQLHSLIEILPVGVVVADRDGGLVEVNNAAKDIWGGDVLDADSLEEYDKFPVRWADTGDPVERDEWTIARVLQGEEITDPGIFEIEAADGERRTLSVRGMPIRDEYGVVTRGVITLTDITERREYQHRLERTIEQLEASNERLEHFAYAASHDLQEPLRMISSYLQLIENRYSDALDAEGEEFLAFATDGADRMREMIHGLLEYSRIETQGDPFEPIDLESTLEAVSEDIQIRIEESGADVSVDDELPRVRGDASQLRQLFQNLLSNAIEYSGDEPPRISVTADRTGSMWTVSVSDGGIGIEPADQDRIFEVFQRLHSHDEHDGTGIGLAICQRIVERHDGDIWVDSVPGEGTTVSFTLPTAE
ncbi:PAS domain S-box protein [Halobacteria archaeon AArc-m2/3/4]|uniref:histidine kinase n=1 Tax=Natronoglomus mannanivorans TaxID=2979990 RepID=A0AAP3E1X1_9EURY|nr:PAS domain S-box protein [Halobacteria archaeon AArc-xg1-1]MCU4975787.1 PAS domain S-box protein [Halobacteria archaeon AArc-m2/3/4]